MLIYVDFSIDVHWLGGCKYMTILVEKFCRRCFVDFVDFVGHKSEKKKES